MSYDKADWHYGAEDFPEDLPVEAGGVHIGMFLAWALTRGLAGEIHLEVGAEGIEEVRGRRMTGCHFLFEHCDERLTEEDLSDEGNAFARHYYGHGGRSGAYFDDYAATLERDVPGTYHVADTWENFDALAPVIDRRWARWRARRDRPWWRFW